LDASRRPHVQWIVQKQIPITKHIKPTQLYYDFRCKVIGNVSTIR